MVRVKPKAKAGKSSNELDSVYFLKLVLYLILGTLWLHVQSSNGHTQIPLPIGFAVGLLFAAHDHFKIDRKIEYAVLLIAMLVGFWAQIGLYITY